MRTRHKLIKPSLFFIVFIIKNILLFAQTIGTNISVTGVDGKIYTGIIKNISGKWYQVKYDGYNALRWLKADQFKVSTTTSSEINLIGKHISFPGTDGKTYTGVVLELQGNKYRVKYDGYNFESWLDREQFSLDTSTAVTINNYQGSIENNAVTVTTENNATAALSNIYNYGSSKGWSSPVFEIKYAAFINKLSPIELKTLLVFLQNATTSSAQFFALKSLLTGDSDETVKEFIEELNQHDEAYQQKNCLATNLNFIIQQWQFSCSVTVVQTYLADLCPRYAWQVTKIADFDKIANDPATPMAEQQKQLLEKYGGVASARGDLSGTPIGLLNPINELVGALLGVSFYAQEVTKPLDIVFGKIRTQLDKGINTPLLISFTGTASRHFILAMRYQQTTSGYKYLIYDPWDGKCDYVSQSSIEQGSLHPMLSGSTISLDYYYPIN